MLQPEAEGTNEEPPLHHDDFINQMDELSDGDEVTHYAHSIICSSSSTIQLHNAKTFILYLRSVANV